MIRLGSELLDRYIASRGYMVHGTTVLGDYAGYPFSMRRRESASRALISVTLTTSGQLTKKMIKELRRDMPKKTGIMPAARKANAILITQAVRDDADLGDLETTLRIVTAGLRDFGLKPPTACAVCGGEGSDAYAWHRDAYQSVHRNCIVTTCQNTVAVLTEEQTNGSYSRGAVGAFLGALAGAIPNFLTIYFAQYIIGYLCALIPLASYGGYRLFRGKPRRPATVIILLCSLLQVFLLEQAVWYASIVEYFGIWPSVWDSFLYYLHSFDRDSIISLGQTGLFVLIGIAISFGHINRTAEKEIKSTMAVMETVRDKTA